MGNRNNYIVTILKKINMAPEIYLDVFIIDNNEIPNQEANEETPRSEKQVELRAFF